MLGLKGKKLGMTQLFNEVGEIVAVTVIELPPATVLEQKTKEKHGYTGIKVASGKANEKRQTKAQAGVFKKANLPASKWLTEIRLDDTKDYELGKTLDVSMFADE